MQQTQRNQTQMVGIPVPRDKKNLTSGGAEQAKSRKRLVKPAVVTITGKSGGAPYAQILAKAREKVSLKDLGIQDIILYFTKCAYRLFY